MRTITHREMRNNSGEILRAVAAGETLQVTNNGRVAAVISPPTRDALAQLEAQGQVRLPRRPLVDLASISRGKASRASADILADARGTW